MAASLQSQAHRDLLDIVDRLRAQGLSRHVDLPEIIVAGDRSAGKSSVLEAISGMPFPTKNDVGTRFVTELILRRSPHAGIRVSMTPDAGRPEHEQEQLRRFGPAVDVADLRLGEVVERAGQAIGLDGPSGAISNDILRVEMSGPEMPHLAMVDLPGLVQAGNSSQSDADAKRVRAMVLRYMRRPRSIVLAVVSAKSDFALQEVTHLARESDRDGLRTLALITKPDTLDEGSDREAAYVQLAQNRDVRFRLGWHVLKNRDSRMRGVSSAERDAAEADFFSHGAWTAVNPAHLGVAALRPRLGNVLKGQMLQQLPDLLADVEHGIASCSERLKKLGDSRGCVGEQRRYLLRTSQAFSQLMRAAVDGVYKDAFFGSAKTDEGYQRRLRAVVQNTLMEFGDEMHRRGRSRQIIEFSDDEDPELGPGEVLRSDYVREVRDLISRSRGCELPGTFNPLVVGELFAEQCQPWNAIAAALKDDVLRAVSETSIAALCHVAVEDTTERILQVVNSGIDDLKKDLDTAFEQVLEPYRGIHPITYDHQLTQNVHKAQADRRRRELESHVKSMYGVNALTDARRLLLNGNELSMLLREQGDHDMELYGSALAVDYMEAYYKVALRTFVDAVSTLAIECRLLQKLPSILDPEKMHDMSDEEVSRLAADDEASVLERARLSERLAVLETAQRELKRLDSFRSVAAGRKSAREAPRAGAETPDEREDKGSQLGSPASEPAVQLEEAALELPARSIGSAGSSDASWRGNVVQVGGPLGAHGEFSDEAESAKLEDAVGDPPADVAVAEPEPEPEPAEPEPAEPEPPEPELAEKSEAAAVEYAPPDPVYAPREAPETTGEDEWLSRLLKKGKKKKKKEKGFGWDREAEAAEAKEPEGPWT